MDDFPVEKLDVSGLGLEFAEKGPGVSQEIRVSLIGKASIADDIRSEEYGYGALENREKTARDSRQKLDEFDYTWTRCAEPPVDIAKLVDVWMIDLDIQVLCNVVAGRVCGRQLQIVPNPVMKAGATPNEEQKSRLVKWIIEAGTPDPRYNDCKPLLQTVKAAVIDRNLTGNGYLELTRRGNNDPDRLFYAPSREMRRKLDMSGYVQLTASGGYQEFKNFGDTRTIFPTRDQVVPGAIHQPTTNMGLAGGRRWISKAIGGTELPLTEIIHLYGLNPYSRYYDIPPTVVALDAIYADRCINNLERSYFENGGSPDMIVTVSGGSLNADSIKRVEAFLQKNVAGSKNAHKILVLEGMEPDVKIDVKPSGAALADLQFPEGRKWNRDSKIRSFRVPPRKAGVLEGDVSDRSQEEAFKLDIIEPQQTEIESVFDQITAAIGVTDWVIRFEDMDTRDKSADANRLKTMATTFAYTLNDILKEDGREAIPGGNVIFIPKGYVPIKPAELEEMADKMKEGFISGQAPQNPNAPGQTKGSGAQGAAATGPEKGAGAAGRGNV